MLCTNQIANHEMGGRSEKHMDAELAGTPLVDYSIFLSMVTEWISKSCKTKYANTLGQR